MSSLLADIGETYKSEMTRPLGSVSGAAPVPTGFTSLDYECAVESIDETNNNEPIVNVGIEMGKLVLFVGNSQGGKTTLALQIAESMTQMGGEVIDLDFERASTDIESRVCNITGISREEYKRRFMIMNHDSLSTEFLKELVFKIAEKKKAIKAKDLIDWYDYRMNPMRIYPPTIIIIDSIPYIKTKEVLTDATLDSQTVAGRIAAANSTLLNTIQPLLERYNISLFAINHIKTKMIMNAYAPREVLLPGLAPEENLPGGKCWPYGASYAIKLTSGKEYKDDKDYGVKARISNAQLLKSRSSFNGVRIPMFLHGRSGFSDEYTLLEYARTNKVLKGTGRGYWLPGHDEDTFTLKNFGEKIQDEAFRDMFINYFEEHLLDDVLGREPVAAEPAGSLLGDIFDDEDDE